MDIRMHAVEITGGCRFDIGLGMGRNVVDSSRAKEMARARKCSTRRIFKRTRVTVAGAWIALSHLPKLPSYEMMIDLRSPIHRMIVSKCSRPPQF
jgi:hypothetical protein